MQSIKRTCILFISFFGTSSNLFSQTNTPCSAGVIHATTIPVNTTCNYQSGTTVGATQQTNAANGGTPSCGSMGEDVWYSFIAPASSSYRISTTAGSITDGVMALYSGTCGAFTQLACSDDAVGLMPEITQNLDLNTTYLIRFWQYGGGTGTFNICVEQAVTLPLTLLSFSGKRVGNNHMLYWETAMEENTSHFEIEKSRDGINFTFLTQIPAVGSGSNNYFTKDEKLHPGTNYYRLKSVDKDGRYTFSKIIRLQVDASIDKALRVYPSLAQNEIQIMVTQGTIPHNAVINIYSFQGQKMKTIASRGQQSTSIDISHYSAGMYIVELVSDNIMLQTKFVKIN